MEKRNSQLEHGQPMVVVFVFNVPPTAKVI